MFPATRLQRLPSLTESTYAAPSVHPLFVEIAPGGGGGGIGFPPSGGIDLGGGNPASGGGSGRTVGFPLPGGAMGSAIGAGGSWLSSMLGIPAINWGRIAAFLLGLILIAGGIYLIRPVNQIVNKSAKAAIAA